jgi:hypothetical protein
MKKSYPRWLVPRLSDVVVDVVTTRARLGGQARAAQMTDEERSEAGRRANRVRNKNLSPERRSELAGIAGRARWKGHIKGPKKRPPRLDPEETRARKALGGSRGQAKRMTTTTPEQRSEWSRIAGIKAAEKRWAGHERKWPKQKPKNRGRNTAGTEGART